MFTHIFHLRRQGHRFHNNIPQGQMEIEDFCQLSPNRTVTIRRGGLKEWTLFFLLEIAEVNRTDCFQIMSHFLLAPLTEY